MLPALLLNYFGQGALVLADPTAIENPFYRLVPELALLPMVVLATAATVIASQAVITGAYSLMHQAIQLGLLPRLDIRHTSASHIGQIYIPRVNIALLVGVLLLVGLFRTSSALARPMASRWRRRWWSTALLAVIVMLEAMAAGRSVAALLVIAAAGARRRHLLLAATMKLFEGAWAPLLFGTRCVLLILTWRRGTRLLAERRGAPRCRSTR